MNFLRRGTRKTRGVRVVITRAIRFDLTFSSTTSHCSLSTNRSFVWRQHGPVTPRKRGWRTRSLDRRRTTAGTLPRTETDREQCRRPAPTRLGRVLNSSNLWPGRKIVFPIVYVFKMKSTSDVLSVLNYISDIVSKSSIDLGSPVFALTKSYTKNCQLKRAETRE